MTKGYSSFIVFLFCTYTLGFGWSSGCLGWLVPNEISPLEIRSAGQSISVAVNLLVTFVLAQVFLSMPFEIWHISLLCRLVRDHDCIHLFSPPGDQECAY